MPRGNHPNSQTMKATLGLRELVFNGTFAPGERVSELRLVEELGVSRTPLRIALVTLEHEGLLETLKGGGFVVREFTRAEVDDAIELRGVLEGTAARLAAERLDSPVELEELHELSSEMDVLVRDPSVGAFVSYAELNERFHALLVGLAKSPPLTRAVEKIVTLPFASPSGALVAVQAALREAREIILIAQDQHRSILDAVARGEGARAEALAREHARMARRNLDVALENRDLLDRVPGGTLIRLPYATSFDGTAPGLQKGVRPAGR
jgi:GntR family transcriptional regulator, vanillate catabolism transcriptional regulator